MQSSKNNRKKFMKPKRQIQNLDFVRNSIETENLI